MTGIIILAAGASSRLGEPKQNLVYKGRSLLQNSIDAALGSACRPVIVVLGANEKLIRPNIQTHDIQIFCNLGWQEGMSSSIRFGVQNLLQLNPHIKQVILMVCDQPFVNSGLLNMLIAKQAETGKSIIASSYNEILGTPVLFSRALFIELQKLEGQQGAKKLFSKYKNLLTTISFPSGGTDIDTIEDYQSLS